MKGICLHEHKIDHIAHLGPSAAAGIGTALNLPTETIYQAVQQALHVTTTTRQSRKGEISSWKAYAPAFAGKMAIEAVDRVMRGEGAPSPAWEGEDGFIAWLLSGPKAEYSVPLPEKGEPKRAILDTYTKEHSAEYQSQALIDLARRMGPKIGDLTKIESIVIHTSHHTHYVIGTGANDPQKIDPKASRETLDHSIMYIFAVALEDGGWHHQKSYAPERAARPETVALWRKISTLDDPAWTRRYHSHDPKQKAFGGHVVVTLKGGSVISDEIAVADAHPLGARPFARAQYVAKFRSLARRYCRVRRAGPLPHPGRAADRAEDGRTRRTDFHSRSEAARYHRFKRDLRLVRRRGDPLGRSRIREKHMANEISATSTPVRKKSVALSVIVAGNTALCTVGRTGNDLHYRGYDILDVAETCEFEEIAHLLVHGNLPTQAELAAYKAKLKNLRGLPLAVRATLEALPAAAHPMDVMRSGVSALGCVLPEVADHNHPGARDIADRLMASAWLHAALLASLRPEWPPRRCGDRRRHDRRALPASAARAQAFAIARPRHAHFAQSLCGT